jgi:hypothetical protein
VAQNAWTVGRNRGAGTAVLRRDNADIAVIGPQTIWRVSKFFTLLNKRLIYDPENSTPYSLGMIFACSQPATSSSEMELKP